MKRDMDLIRGLLLQFEANDSARLSRKELQLEGYTQEQIDFHIELMKEAGLLDHHIERPQTSDGYVFRTRFDMGLRPTMAGYDFADSIRDPEVWRRTKEGVAKAGGVGLEFVWELAKAYGKQVIKERIGIDLS